MSKPLTDAEIHAFELYILPQSFASTRKMFTRLLVERVEREKEIKRLQGIVDKAIAWRQGFVHEIDKTDRVFHQNFRATKGPTTTSDHRSAGPYPRARP